MWGQAQWGNTEWGSPGIVEIEGPAAVYQLAVARSIGLPTQVAAGISAGEVVPLYEGGPTVIADGSLGLEVTSSLVEETALQALAGVVFVTQPSVDLYIGRFELSKVTLRARDSALTFIAITVPGEWEQSIKSLGQVGLAFAPFGLSYQGSVVWNQIQLGWVGTGQAVGQSQLTTDIPQVVLLTSGEFAQCAKVSTAHWGTLLAPTQWEEATRAWSLIATVLEGEAEATAKTKDLPQTQFVPLGLGVAGTITAVDGPAYYALKGDGTLEEASLLTVPARLIAQGPGTLATFIVPEGAGFLQAEQLGSTIEVSLPVVPAWPAGVSSGVSLARQIGRAFAARAIPTPGHASTQSSVAPTALLVSYQVGETWVVVQTVGLVARSLEELSAVIAQSKADNWLLYYHVPGCPYPGEPSYIAIPVEALHPGIAETSYPEFKKDSC
jgi:hypothetical protein